MIFSLIRNVDEIRFSYNSGLEFYFKRDEMDSFFGQKLVAFGKDRDKWEKELLNKLNSEETVNSFYSKYNILK